MAKVIGPSFEAELRAAGVLGLAFSVDDSGLYMDALTPAQKTTVQAVYDAHNATTVRPDADKDLSLDTFLDSTGGAAFKSLVVVLRSEINTLRAALPAPLPAYTFIDWRTKLKTAYRALVS